MAMHTNAVGVTEGQPDKPRMYVPRMRDDREEMDRPSAREVEAHQFLSALMLFRVSIDLSHVLLSHFSSTHSRPEFKK